MALNDSEDASSSMVASDSDDVNDSNGSALTRKPGVAHGFGPGAFKSQ